MGLSSRFAAVVMVVALAVGGGGRVAEGQSTCAAELVPCAQYLNSTTPSTECCSAIRSVVRSELECLCRLYNNPQAVPGINMTQALQLPRYCNISNDVSACNRAAAPGSPTLTPPGTAGSGSGRDNNAASTTSWMGMPVLLLVSALAFFY